MARPRPSTQTSARPKRSTHAPSPPQRPPAAQLLDEPCIAAFAALATTAGPQVVAVTRATPVRFAAATDIVATAAGVAPGDVQRHAPAGPRWGVEEVNQLLGRLAVLPPTRSVVAVDAADRMERSGHDRLLRTLEEPSTDVAILLAVPDVAALPKTLAARCTRTVAVGVPNVVERAERCAAFGLTGSLAADRTAPLVADLDLAGEFATFADAVAAWHRDPAPGSYELVRRCDALADVLSQVLGANYRSVQLLELAVAELRQRVVAAAACASPPAPSLIAALDAFDTVSAALLHEQAKVLTPFLVRLAVAYHRHALDG